MKAVSHLRELHLCRVELSTEQLVSLLEACVAARGKFEEVNLSAMDLSQVESTSDNPLPENLRLMDGKVPFKMFR